MRVLLLGPTHPKIEQHITSSGDTLIRYEKRISTQSSVLRNIDFIVSFGYRYIIKSDVLRQFPKRVINLHISFLPWNKGADPNLWSFLEDTPKGVTIHYIDPGLDTGDILAQREVMMQPDDTLRTSYERLTTAIENLFCDVWMEIRTGNRLAVPQPDGGSFHRLKDKQAVEHLLYKGWDTPVKDLIGKAKEIGKEVVVCR